MNRWTQMESVSPRFSGGRLHVCMILRVCVSVERITTCPVSSVRRDFQSQKKKKMFPFRSFLTTWITQNACSPWQPEGLLSLLSCTERKGGGERKRRTSRDFECLSVCWRAENVLKESKLKKNRLPDLLTKQHFLNAAA